MASSSPCRSDRGSIGRVAAGTGLLVLALAGFGPAQAADLLVRVQDDQGRRLGGAAVCAGTPGRPSQFGALYSDETGGARFPQVPATEVSLVVSRAGYRGEALRLGAVRFDRLVIVTLSPGGLGPACEPDAPPPGAGRSSALRILDLRVADLSGTGYPPTVSLSYSVDGEADQYRLSERADFSGAAWRALDRQPSIQLGGGGKRTLYLQVRRYRELGEGVLSIESDVVSVDLEVGARP